MSFSKRLEGLLDRGKARLEKELQTHTQGPSNPGPALPPHGNGSAPPAIPSWSKPGSAAPHPVSSYWKPDFNPSVPVSQHFGFDQGAHGWGNNELQNYVDAPANSFHTPSGALVIRAIADGSASGDKYTSARLTSHQTLARDRGCVTVRLTPPSAPGIWPAFWLLPQDPFVWPTDGEIDIFESWNGDGVNHTCLHWGFFTGEDHWKHRVTETNIRDIVSEAGHEFSFGWDQPENGKGGRMVWWIDGVPVMKAEVPAGTRKLRDFRVIMNIACGGNVCQGKVPADGHYDYKIHELRFDEEPAGGWGNFERAWSSAPEGHTM